MNNVNVILTILQNMTGNNRVGTYNTISIIYINKNPFVDYKLTITEKDLTYTKNITMN